MAINPRSIRQNIKMVNGKPVGTASPWQNVGPQAEGLLTGSGSLNGTASTGEGVAGAMQAYSGGQLAGSQPVQRLSTSNGTAGSMSGAATGTLQGQPSSSGRGLGGAVSQAARILNASRGTSGSMAGPSEGTLVGTGAKRLSGATLTPGPDGTAPMVSGPNSGTLQGTGGRLSGTAGDWRDALMDDDLGLGSGQGGVGGMAGNAMEGLMRSQAPHSGSLMGSGNLSGSISPPALPPLGHDYEDEYSRLRRIPFPNSLMQKYLAERYDPAGPR